MGLSGGHNAVRIFILDNAAFVYWEMWGGALSCWKTTLKYLDRGISSKEGTNSFESIVPLTNTKGPGPSFVIHAQTISLVLFCVGQGIIQQGENFSFICTMKMLTLHTATVS